MQLSTSSSNDSKRSSSHITSCAIGKLRPMVRSSTTIRLLLAVWRVVTEPVAMIKRRLAMTRAAVTIPYRPITVIDTAAYHGSDLRGHTMSVPNIGLLMSHQIGALLITSFLHTTLFTNLKRHKRLVQKPNREHPMFQTKRIDQTEVA